MTTPDESQLSPFARELSRAMLARNMTLARLQGRLADLGQRVSLATLSYWRSGQRHPERATSKEVLGVIEEILGLDSGKLEGLVGPGRRPLSGPSIAFDELTGVPNALDDLLAAIDLTDHTDLVSRGGTLVVEIGADRRVVRTTNRMVWTARRDGARRTPFCFKVDEPTGATPVVEAVAGCSIGRTAYDETSGMLAAEMILGRALTINETAITETTIDESRLHRNTVDSYDLVAERRVTESMLWVRFHPEALPSSVEAYEDTDDGMTVRRVLVTDNAVHYIVRNFGPGLFGLRWSWARTV